MAYLALYRKYRPQTFDDIMGQEHVTRTLQNALRFNRVAHAYLFCGPRGTAKTTTARVLAKALNCEHGPTPDPCDRCDACERIREGRSLDVVEIDAASNRGIDDIKMLREKVGRASAQERYKLYIIDEVHQLSADAFQALLKTLEEPPPNVVFVLATTETHRVPKTIVSRCQHFDFRRGTIKELSDRLKYVADSEGMIADPDALGRIARAAAGGWRDALSLLEQIASYSPERIDRAAADAVLGSVEENALFRLTGALAESDAKLLFNEIDRLIDEGKEPRQMLSAMNGHLRDLLWVQAGAENAGQIPPETIPRYRDQAKRFDPAVLMSALEAINRAESQMRWISDQRLLLELTLIRIANRSFDAAPGTTHPQATASAPASAPQPTVSSSAAQRPARKIEAPAPTETAASASRSKDASFAPPPIEEADDEPPFDFDEPAPAAPVKSKASDATRHSPPKRAEAPSSSSPEDEFASEDDSIEGGFEDLWKRVIQKVKPNVRGLLTSGKPLGINGTIFRVGLPFESHIQILESKSNREQVEAALKAASGRDFRVKGELLTEKSAPSSTIRESEERFDSETERASISPSANPFETDDFMNDNEFSNFFGAKKLKEGDQ